MNSRLMNAPTISDLQKDPEVIRALDEAWRDSSSNDPTQRHEEGGWVYLGTTTGNVAIRRASPGVQAALDLSAPPEIVGSVVVATFHTHPNPAAEGWPTGPSTGDTESAWLLGVPCLIRAEDGVHSTGPDSRRGGLAGAPGYPK